MKTLDKLLGNDRGEDTNHSDTFLSSLASIQDHIPDTTSFNITSCEFCYQIPTKVLVRFKLTAWLFLVYLADYDAEILDFSLFSEPISGYNVAQ